MKMRINCLSGFVKEKKKKIRMNSRVPSTPLKKDSRRAYPGETLINDYRSHKRLSCFEGHRTIPTSDLFSKVTEANDFLTFFKGHSNS